MRRKPLWTLLVLLILLHRSSSDAEQPGEEGSSIQDNRNENAEDGSKFSRLSSSDDEAPTRMDWTDEGHRNGTIPPICDDFPSFKSDCQLVEGTVKAERETVESCTDSKLLLQKDPTKLSTTTESSSSTMTTPTESTTTIFEKWTTEASSTTMTTPTESTTTTSTSSSTTSTTTRPTTSTSTTTSPPTTKTMTSAPPSTSVPPLTSTSMSTTEDSSTAPSSAPTSESTSAPTAEMTTVESTSTDNPSTSTSTTEMSTAANVSVASSTTQSPTSTTESPSSSSSTSSSSPTERVTSTETSAPTSTTIEPSSTSFTGAPTPSSTGTSESSTESSTPATSTAETTERSSSTSATQRPTTASPLPPTSTTATSSSPLSSTRSATTTTTPTTTRLSTTTSHEPSTTIKSTTSTTSSKKPTTGAPSPTSVETEVQGSAEGDSSQSTISRRASTEEMPSQSTTTTATPTTTMMSSTTPVRPTSAGATDAAATIESSSTQIGRTEEVVPSTVTTFEPSTSTTLTSASPSTLFPTTKTTQNDSSTTPTTLLSTSTSTATRSETSASTPKSTQTLKTSTSANVRMSSATQRWSSPKDSATSETPESTSTSTTTRGPTAGRPQPPASKRFCFEQPSTTTHAAETTTESPTTTSAETSSSSSTQKPTTTSSRRSCFRPRPTGRPSTEGTSPDGATESSVPTTEIWTSTTTEEVFVVNETRCTRPCEKDWTEGVGACFRMVEHSEPTSYTNLSGLCQKMGGMTMPTLRDFEVRANFELFKTLTAVNASSHDWVFVEPEADQEFRRTRRVVAINVTKSHLASFQRKNYSEAEPTSVHAVCKTPRFCEAPKCNLTQYLEHKTAVNLAATRNKTLYHVQEMAKIVCDVTGDKIDLTCGPKGFFSPHPDLIDCFDQEQVHNETRRRHEEEKIAIWYHDNETQINCRDCSEHGTDRCVRNSRGRVECACKEGWIGTTCAKSPDFCAMKPRCKNGGECVNYVTEWYCVCAGNFKGDDCALNVESLDYENETIQRTFMPVTTLYTFLSIAFTVMCLFYCFYDDDDFEHPQSGIQLFKLLSLAGVTIASGLFRHPAINDLDRHAGCRFYNWIINTCWTAGLVAWSFEAHLCWGVMANNFHNVWKFAEEWHLYDHLLYPAIGFSALVFAALSNVFFWDEVRHSWTCIGTLHEEGRNHVLFNFGVNLALLLWAASFAQAASSFRSDDWFRYVRMYRTTHKNPKSYGRHMEVCEKNVNFIFVGPVLHFFTWLLAIVANDVYDEGITNAFIVAFLTYFVVLVCQAMQTHNTLLAVCKNLAMRYGPYSLMPTHNYRTLWSKDEFLAKTCPEKFKRIKDAEKRKEDEKKTKEAAEIEAKNEGIRMRFAEETGQLPQNCPQQHLFHNPDQGPLRVFPLPFVFKPTDECYINEMRRAFFHAEFSRIYLENRLMLPRPSDKNAELAAVRLENPWVEDDDKFTDAIDSCYKANDDVPTIVKRFDEAANHMWMNFCRTVVRQDHLLTAEKLQENLDLLRGKNMAQRESTLTIDDTPMGPRTTRLLRDLDALMPCQTEHYMAMLNKEFERINAPFDRIYDDDLNIPRFTDQEIVTRVRVANVDNETGELSLNPRKRPLDAFFYDVTVPGFIGPLRTEDQHSACLSHSERVASSSSKSWTSSGIFTRMKARSFAPSALPGQVPHQRARSPAKRSGGPRRAHRRR